ncbi:ABC transporter substrate-binding protein [Clostridium sp. CCUG 7971]|uniref:ABC transporter substrate-binding protein n=1 Tax=Clostridium sp. CCUG 7971 TaxID=2811414 RepID=UPI001ABAAD49|nr:ABC transporter substrate-binding protein [Clostridium sp. CCUG 7971]MBO3443566.1 ABC transporter substrate-binding protein [Clostridium sp. CCUG 7971]
MKKIKQMMVFLLSFIFIIGAVGCSPTNEKKDEGKSNSKVEESANKDSHYPVTITTYNYKKEPVEITFNKAPEKVVAIYQNSIETMLALGLEDKIVAAAGLDHDVKDEYKEAFKKVKYLEEFTPSKESIIMEKPDFILSWYSLFDEKRLGEVDYWHKNNINTYMSLNSGVKDEKTIENEITDILNLGKIFNVEDKAKELVDNINKKVEEVSKSVKGKEKQSTLIVEFYDDQITTYGANSLGGDMVKKLGADLLNPQGKKINEEDLINLNPDSIFVVYMDRSDENVPKQEVNKILENKALKSLNAVKNKRVYAIPLGDMYSSGIRTIDGINTFAKGLYPDLKN